MDPLFLLDWKEDIGQHFKYMIVDLELTKLKISQLLVFDKRNFISFAIEMYRCLHFIFYHLCTNHYQASPMIFFSPLNTYFLLSTTCVYSFAMCANHNDFLMGYCTLSRFLIFFTHHW
jgi:hypothetical protein